MSKLKKELDVLLRNTKYVKIEKTNKGYAVECQYLYCSTAILAEGKTIKKALINLWEEF